MCVKGSFKHILPPFSAEQNCQYVWHSRNRQDCGEGKIWAPFPACVTAAGASVASLAAALCLAGVCWHGSQAVPLPGTSACQLREPKGAVSCCFPLMSWSVNEFHCFIHELCCQISLMPNQSMRGLPVFPLVICRQHPGSFSTKATGGLWILLVSFCLAPGVIYPKSSRFFISQFWKSYLLLFNEICWECPMQVQWTFCMSKLYVLLMQNHYLLCSTHKRGGCG